MKTSVNWLKTYIDIPWDAGQLAERLTLAGLEVEGIEHRGSVPEGVVVAKILTREPHPDADRLSVCSVDAGTGKPLQIVCGAPNCDPGLKAPCALIGAALTDNFTVGKAKLRGVTSEGMLCAEDELGLSADHSGLMILPDSAEVGTPLNQLLECDTVIDWEVTPNRPDWNCHIGIAREIAAVNRTHEQLTLPAVSVQECEDAAAGDLARVEVQDPELCPRYVARVIRNVRIGPSPEWLQTWLRSVGVRPINNVVDITNFVMLESGQPLHAFDYDLLAENRIVVRRAEAGETIVTLDDVERTLTDDTLLICDGEGPVALAGVMGGANTEISEKTATVLLESACFDPANIRATSKRVGLSSESSYRFERGVDIEMTEWASRRAVALMCELAGGEAAAGSVDIYPAPFEPAAVTARFGRINQLLGVEVDPDVVAEFMRQLGFTVRGSDTATITVAVPAYRRSDVTREADIIEEVARLYGLDNIPAAREGARRYGMRSDDTFYTVEDARAQLRALGLDETMTYSFLKPEDAVRCTGFADEHLVKPTNPLSGELGTMRPSLIPGVLSSVAHNIAHGNDDLALFELGRAIVHHPDFPEERYQVAVAMTGRTHPERYGDEKTAAVDLFDIKGVLEGWFDARRLTPVCERSEHPAFVEGTCGAFILDGETVALFGQACDDLTEDIRLKHPLFLALVEFDRVTAHTGAPMVYDPLPQFPAVERDVSFVAGKGLSNKEVLDAMRGLGEPLMETVELFDVYEDPETLGEGRKSLAFTVVYRDRAGTLTDKKVNAIHDRLRKHLNKTLDIELR